MTTLAQYTEWRGVLGIIILMNIFVYYLLKYKLTKSGRRMNKRIKMIFIILPVILIILYPLFFMPIVWNFIGNLNFTQSIRLKRIYTDEFIIILVIYIYVCVFILCISDWKKQSPEKNKGVKLYDD